MALRFLSRRAHTRSNSPESPEEYVDNGYTLICTLQVLHHVHRVDLRPVKPFNISNHK